MSRNEILELIESEIKEHTEIFAVHSLDGKKIITESLDGKECDMQTSYKKEGFLILNTNF